MPTKPSKNLQVVPNPTSKRDYEINITTHELTCICPMTSQPDFATLTITYVPDKFIVELKSLKLYLWSFRHEGTFHEAVTNKILDDLIEALNPRSIEVVADFAIRGGIHTMVKASHKKENPAII